jgi:hypothetical protein
MFFDFDSSSSSSSSATIMKGVLLLFFEKRQSVALEKLHRTAVGAVHPRRERSNCLPSGGGAAAGGGRGG